MILKKLVVMIILMIMLPFNEYIILFKTTLQPCNLAHLSWWKGQRDNVSLFQVVLQWSTGSKALVDIPAPGIKRWSFHYHHPIVSPPLQSYKVTFKWSPQIWRKSHPNRRSPSAYLLQLRHEHLLMTLVRRQVESMMVLQGGGWAQKRARWIH